jgi:hypothetical protein
MNTIQTTTTKSLKLSLMPLQVGLIAVALCASAASVAAPTIKLTETQTEKLKCLSDKTCSKLTTGTYKATLTLDFETLLAYPNLLQDFGIAEYLIANHIDLSTIDLAHIFSVSVFSKLSDSVKAALISLPSNIKFVEGTPFGLSVGDFNFTDTFDPTINPKKPTTGTWNSYHSKAAPVTSCTGPKSCVKDGSITWSFGITGVVISLSGSSDQAKGFGQAILATACTDAAAITDADASLSFTKKNIPANLAGSVTIGQTTVPFTVAANCVVKKPADPKNKVNGPFNLVNLSIKN